VSVVLVTAVGAAAGAREAAAALACVASEPDRAALLVDLAAERRLRPSLVATAGARSLEERLAAHLPETAVASRGCICRLSLPADDAVDPLAAALPLVRDSAAIVHLPPALLRPLLDEPRVGAGGALLRADPADDRALTALVAGDLIERGLRVAVHKHPLSWPAGRAALLGALPRSAGALPGRLCERLLANEDKKLRHCYDREDGAKDGKRSETGQGRL
jgi:hypothetical protein